MGIKVNIFIMVLIGALGVFTQPFAQAQVTCQDFFSTSKWQFYGVANTPITLKVKTDGFASIPLKHGFIPEDLSALYFYVNRMKRVETGVLIESFPEFEPLKYKILDSLVEAGLIDKINGEYYGIDGETGLRRHLKVIGVLRTDQFQKITIPHRHDVEISRVTRDILSVTYALMGDGTVVYENQNFQFKNYGPEEIIILNEVENMPYHKSPDGKRVIMILVLSTL